MPHDCLNYITLVGSNKDVKNFIKAVKSEEKIFDFSRIIPPIPDANTDWYVQNWSTKWNSYDELDWSIKSGLDHVCIANTFFLTAWSPPVNILIQTSKMFPKLMILHTFGSNIKYVGDKMYMKGSTILHNDYEWDSVEGKAFRHDLNLA